MDSSSPFSSLPDEVVMKVLKMAMELENNQKHSFLVNTIAHTSSRFKRLSKDKSLWKGQVVIYDYESPTSIAKNINRFGKFPITKIGIIRGVNGGHIQRVALQFPMLEEVCFRWIASWPRLSNPWISLKSLSIGEVHPYSVFENIDLATTVPNLVFLRISKLDFQNSTLPDMTDCKNLEVVEIMVENTNVFPQAMWVFPTEEYESYIPNSNFFMLEHREKIPFPRNLKKLRGYSFILQWNNSTMKEYFENCDCTPN